MKSVVLCYNLKGTAKGKKIGMIFGFLGFKVRAVDKEQYLWPIGALTGMEEPELEPEVYDGDGFPEEMLVIQAETEDMLDKAIFLMQKDRVQVGLKAVVTASNQKWTSLALHDEIKKEHEIMKRREAERKG
ncbi:DUF3783 domain-containing protein [Lachnospiraceae bacterium KGMB03038]|nr:DUF3783 domain-containing protein [Lachnospiraceae bacterium KGMB03038]